MRNEMKEIGARKTGGGPTSKMASINKSDEKS
jgi:hypothetical protein